MSCFPLLVGVIGDSSRLAHVAISIWCACSRIPASFAAEFKKGSLFSLSVHENLPTALRKWLTLPTDVRVTHPARLEQSFCCPSFLNAASMSSVTAGWSMYDVCYDI